MTKPMFKVLEKVFASEASPFPCQLRPSKPLQDCAGK